MDGKPRSKTWKLLLICVGSAFANVAASALANGVLMAPLYLDTVFTIAVTFGFGLLPGLVTCVVFYPVQNALYNFFLNIDADGATGNLFVLCAVSEILVVHLFCVKNRAQLSSFRNEPSLSSFVSMAAPFMGLVALDCIIISIVGGVIDFILNNTQAIQTGFYPEDLFKLGLIRNNMPFLVAAILSRIPINIVDRFIGVFGGYGISLLYRRWYDGRDKYSTQKLQNRL
jgi:hypothetical protein